MWTVFDFEDEAIVDFCRMRRTCEIEGPAAGAGFDETHPPSCFRGSCRKSITFEQTLVEPEHRCVSCVESR